MGWESDREPKQAPTPPTGAPTPDAPQLPDEPTPTPTPESTCCHGCHCDQAQPTTPPG